MLKMCAKVLAFVVVLTGTALGFNWNENVRPKVVVNYVQNSKAGEKMIPSLSFGIIFPVSDLHDRSFQVSVSKVI